MSFFPAILLSALELIDGNLLCFDLIDNFCLYPCALDVGGSKGSLLTVKSEQNRIERYLFARGL